MWTGHVSVLDWSIRKIYEAVNYYFLFGATYIIIRYDLLLEIF